MVETQAPLNWKQLKDLDYQLPSDTQVDLMKEEINMSFGNELMGIAGLRRVEVEPKKIFII